LKYGVAIFPSKHLQDKANAFRKRYDSHYGLISPHITLKDAFEVNDSEIKQLVSQLREIAKEFKPFLLNVYKYSSSTPVSNTIYMKIKENDQLLKLQKQLNSDNLEQKENHQLIPHIIIGQDLNDDEFHDILGRLRMKSLHHEEICDRFQLLYQLENGSWTVYETFLLEKEA
jgi:2'-5' RNA ligase